MMLDQVGFAPLGASNPIPSIDVRVVLAGAGIIRVESTMLFSTVDSRLCRCFLERVFLAREIYGATITPSATPHADLHFEAEKHRAQNVLRRLATLLTDGFAKDEPRRERLCIAPAIAARDQRGVVRYQPFEHLVTGWQVMINQ